MSGAQTSTSMPLNELYNMVTGATGLSLQSSQNELMKQQQDITDHDIAMTGQAAAPLLNLNEDQAAAAYPGWRQEMQSRGLAKYAPETYPGHAATQALVQRAMPILQQIQTGFLTTPGSADATKRLNDIYTGAGTPPAASPAAGAPATSGAPATGVAANAGALRDQLVSTLGVSPVDAGAILSNFHAESGLNAGINEIHPVIPGSRGGYGLAQWTGPRRDALEAFAQQNKLDVSQPATQLAFMKQELQQPEYAGVLQAMQAAQTPEEKAAIFFHGYLSGNAPSLEHNLPGHVARASAYAGLPAAQAKTAPPGAPTAPGTPPPYRVASNAPTPPPTVPGAPSATPQPTYTDTETGLPVIGTQPGAPAPQPQASVGNDLVGPRPLPPIGPGSPVVTPQSLANTPAPQPQAQIPQPPANRVMPGSADGPPAVQQPPPPTQQQPPAPATRANLPRASEVPIGLQSQQVQQAQDLLRRAAQIEMVAAQNPYDQRLKATAAAQAADLKQRAQVLMQTDNIVQTQEGQLHTLTGKLDESAKPLADYHETSPGSGIWVGGPGTDPKFQPPGRLIIDKAGDVWRTTTGGAEKLSRLDPVAVAALNEAAAAGTATGTAVAKQLPELMATARNAAAQEGQIDYATNQLREAAKGGVPSGYFSDGLATAAAAAKSLGLDGALRAVGVNPEAVGNVQTAQKTLSVIGGAILRQALGSGSAITDAKIEAFIHTQPGIETDPQALQRIMAWARSQYTYERELGTAAVTEAAKPENAGRLPPHWLPAYYRDHGFAPIYDPGTQEMKQPDGTQPARETPPAQSSQATQPPALPPAAAAKLKEGVNTHFGNGQTWTLQNGKPVQVQ